MLMQQLLDQVRMPCTATIGPRVANCIVNGRGGGHILSHTCAKALILHTLGDAKLVEACAKVLKMQVHAELSETKKEEERI